MITHERLLEVLDYNETTGKFYWKIKTNQSVVIGSEAGCIKKDKGYVLLRVDRVLYRAHRLAWFYVHGVWPKQQIDHKDGDKANNNISNLREASNSQNNINKPLMRTNKSGVKGVWFNPKTKRFRVALQVNKKNRTIGHFKSLEEAAKAYDQAAIKYFGEYALTNEMLSK